MSYYIFSFDCHNEYPFFQGVTNVRFDMGIKCLLSLIWPLSISFVCGLLVFSLCKMKPRPPRPRSTFRTMTSVLASAAPLMWNAVLTWNNASDDASGMVVVGKMIEENCLRIQKEDMEAEGGVHEIDESPSPMRRVLNSFSVVGRTLSAMIAVDPTASTNGVYNPQVSGV